MDNYLDKLNFDNNKVYTLLFVIAIIFVLLIFYIIYRLSATHYIYRVLTKKILNINAGVKYEILSKDIPDPKTGMEYGYSFWIYLQNQKQLYTKKENTVTPQDKLLFIRSGDQGITAANPIVTLDGMSNTIHIAIKTQNSTLIDTAETSYSSNPYFIRSMNYFRNKSLSLNSQNASINQYIVLTIDYVPLQRWVHLAYVVNNKTISIFMDGDIYSVHNTDEYSVMREKEYDAMNNEIKVNKIVDNTNGNLIISSLSENGTQGYLSKIGFFNYSATINDIKKVYRSGPLNKSIIGLGSSYALRNPIYKRTEEVHE